MGAKEPKGPVDYSEPIKSVTPPANASSKFGDGVEIERLGPIPPTGETELGTMQDMVGSAVAELEAQAGNAIGEREGAISLPEIGSPAQPEQPQKPPEPVQPRLFNPTEFLEQIKTAVTNLQTAVTAIIDAKKNQATRTAWEAGEGSKGLFGTKLNQLKRLEDNSWLNTSPEARKVARTKALTLCGTAIRALVPSLEQVAKMANMKIYGALFQFAEKNRPKDLGPTQHMHDQVQRCVIQLASELSKYFSDLPEHADKAFNLMLEQKFARLGQDNIIISALRRLVANLVETISDDRCNISENPRGITKKILIAALDGIKTGSTLDKFNLSLPK
ncbi:MAG: hypothetical protein WC873_04665 [Candidatus Gracilibacteria bacterium]